jgi:exopolyphosphatase/guanosine-5'-triphosphate,3'-diphosphate pyrophosphatase
MRIAIIDLGTNSVRFDVHQLSNKKKKLLHREKMMVRLGHGVFLKGKVDPSATERTIHAFKHFKKIADRLKVDKMVAFGTSALREASDSDLLLKEIKVQSGIDVKIISGVEEAKLIALGILSNESMPAGKIALVDIGGGSTEVNICEKGEILFSHSFDLGTARLQQVFLKRSPPKASAILEMRRHIYNTVRQRMLGEHWPRVNEIIGSSGTVRALAKILRKQNGKKAIPIDELSTLVHQMSRMNTSQLLSIDGIESRRVDMILAGAILMDELGTLLKAKGIRPTEYSLRDGILEEEAKLVREHKGSRIELHWEDLYLKAMQFGVDKKYIHQMADLASDLFDRLQRIHRLGPNWKIYLTASVILRDIGELVNLLDYQKHTYYIVKNADFPSMQKWEMEFIAQLCLYQANEKNKFKIARLKDKEKKDAFKKILAILRVIDALDFGPGNFFKVHAVRIHAKKVEICLKGKVSKGMESIMIDRKKALFEKLFNRKVVLTRI